MLFRGHCGLSIVTSIIGTFFVASGRFQEHHGSSLQGRDRHRDPVLIGLGRSRAI